MAYGEGMDPAEQPRPSDLLIRDEHSLLLLEAPGGDGVFNPDGTVNVAILRPCDGRGPGGRIYPAKTLQEAAPSFSGLPSYLNHEDPRARRAAAKMRRGPDELAGELRETVWDPAFTTPEDQQKGYLPGGIVGKFMPASDLVEGLIRRIPKQMKLSINTQAGKMSRAKRADGSPGWLVESIANDPQTSSVDLVTAAGAGGGVLSLVESIYDASNETTGLAALAELDDTRLVEWLQANRPTVLTTTGGADDMNLQEALQSEEVKGYIATQINEGIAAAIPALLTGEHGTALRESVRDEVRDELGQTSRLRGLHLEATRLIEAAPLTPAAKTNLLQDFGLIDNDDDTVTPGRSLALIEAVIDANGAVTKTAKAVLKDSIDAEVARMRNVLREAAPTIPIAPGGGSGSETTPTAAFGGEGSGWAARLRAKGLDPTKYGATPIPAATT